VAQRYGSRIGAYEVWNEANLRTFWTGTPGLMAQLTQVAYSTINELNPNAVVLAPSVTTRLSSGGRFSAALIDAWGGNAPFDAWAIHSYPAGSAGVTYDGSCNADPALGQTPADCIDTKSAQEAAAQRVRDVRQWQQAIVGVVGPESPLLDKPIWDTEINYGLPGPGINPGVAWSESMGASLIEYTLADSAALGMDNTFWYQFTATPYDLLGVQMTPSTPQTLEAWATPATVTSGNQYELPIIGGCTYRFSMKCPKANLRNANLSGARLGGSNFDGADLYRANLKNSTLRGTAVKARFYEADLTNLDGRDTNFSNANMMRVSAVRADLRRANLVGADLRGANLEGADLRGANLAGADFRGANLAGANLRGVDVKDALFNRGDLSGAKR
jgi:hypothetical protein